MTPFKSTSETIACTLSADDLKDVRAAWQKLFRTSLISRDLVPGGLRLTVHPGAELALRQLIEVETACCKWITFELEPTCVTMTAPGDGEQVIQAMWTLDPPV